MVDLYFDCLLRNPKNSKNFSSSEAPAFRPCGPVHSPQIASAGIADKSLFYCFPERLESREE